MRISLSSATLLAAVAALTITGSITGSAALAQGSDAMLRAQTRAINRAVGDQLRDARTRAYTALRTSNLRTEPSLRGPVIGQVPRGTEVTVMEEAADGTWYRVQVGDRSGYMAKALLAPR